MTDKEDKGLKLLSLGTFSKCFYLSVLDPDSSAKTDGGGIRGLSTLYILKMIMISLEDQMKLPKEPLPCEVFDLIGGTSTGG